MSDSALAWVRFHAQFPPGTKDATALKYTLMEYAHEARSGGDLAFITMSELAERTECDFRTAQRRTAKLVALGLLVRSNFQDVVVPLFRADRRPVVYRIVGMPALPPISPGSTKKRKSRGPADERQAEAARWAKSRRYFDERRTP